LFVNNYIGELQKKDTTLTDNLDSITKLHKKISDIIAFNNRIHNDIKKLDENIENEFEKKKRILAQTDGLTEEQLLANYNNISSWSDKRRTALNKIEFLKRNRIEHVQKLETAQAELSKMAEGTDAEVYAKVFEIINQIQMAFKSAKETNKKRLMMDIEDKANHYLESLNSNDFKGTIRIIEKTDGQAAAVLTNSDGTRIFNPNTALRTTYLMSVLFAIGKLSSDRQETELPLIFDAPTSSFTEAKESEFFDVISSFNKQVIIVTKSFLKDEGNGKLKLDRTKVNGVNGNVYRIQKKEPFDDKNLGTIQTVISKVK
jgi:DNA sulfur modification protein DndD